MMTIAMVTVGIAITLWTVWRCRAPIADLIRGRDGHGTIRSWLAELWPIVATAISSASVRPRVRHPRGEQVLSRQGIFSVLLVDRAADRRHGAVQGAPRGRRLTSPKAGRPRARLRWPAYEDVFAACIHIVVVVIGLVLFSKFWGLDLFAFAQQSMGGKISSSLLGICIVLLLAYMIWEGRRRDRPPPRGRRRARPRTPASRLRTMLPLLRALILVTIVVMATMSVLAALGVDILPLLAGASVVGVAIGFGSQTLVRDIVSGAFFLMDDAFRLGEYIEVGDAKGRVEKINVRSLFLRHHRGALNILPTARSSGCATPTATG
jgi:small-conductance mechanosensitive channel